MERKSKVQKLQSEVSIAEKLIINLSKCDPKCQIDVLTRCADWIESGGKFSDDYILINQFNCIGANLRSKGLKDIV